MPVPKEEPPEAAAYQLIVPAEAAAPRLTIPLPHLELSDTEFMVGLVFIVADTAVLETLVQPLFVASA